MREKSSQMVPGPASSQVGYLIGLRRAEWRGAFAAWAGFTLPSALVMFAFALLAPHLEGPATNAVLPGLKLVAVAVVAQAVWSMARNLCPDRPRAALALLTAALLLVISGSFVQITALLVGAVGGAFFGRWRSLMLIGSYHPTIACCRTCFEELCNTWEAYMAI
jgi:chromate transporter